jgi:hypothetical protein
MNSKLASEAGSAPELIALFAQPDNPVTLRALLEAVDSNNAPIVVLGTDRMPYGSLPDWSDFLRRQARELGVPLRGAGDDPEIIESDILSATSQLYLDDAVEVRYGSEVIESPARRSLDMAPYLSRDVLVATSNTLALRRSIAKARLPHEIFSWKDLARIARYGHLGHAVLLCELDPADGRDSVDWLVDWVNEVQRPFLFIGLPPNDVPLLDKLRETGRSGPHFALLNSNWRSGRVLRFLYARHIRPVWYAPDSPQLEFLLVLMAESGVWSSAFRPVAWPVRAAPSNVVVADAYPPVVQQEVATQPSDNRLPAPTPPKEILEACLRNECVAFVGSGLSARAGLPTWRGLVLWDWN